MSRHCALTTLEFSGGPSDCFNGWNLKVAREARGMDLAGCAAALDIPVERLRVIEANETIPTAEEITRIRMVLKFPVAFFFRKGPVEKVEGFICGEGIRACRFCGHVAEALCDYPIAPGKTCDAPLCASHRIRQHAGPLKHESQDLDFCPTHALIARGAVTTGREEERP